MCNLILYDKKQILKKNWRNTNVVSYRLISPRSLIFAVSGIVACVLLLNAGKKPLERKERFTPSWILMPQRLFPAVVRSPTILCKPRKIGPFSNGVLLRCWQNAKVLSPNSIKPFTCLKLVTWFAKVKNFCYSLSGFFFLSFPFFLALCLLLPPFSLLPLSFPPSLLSKLRHLVQPQHYYF